MQVKMEVVACVGMGTCLGQYSKFYSVLLFKSYKVGFRTAMGFRDTCNGS